MSELSARIAETRKRLLQESHSSENAVTAAELAQRLDAKKSGNGWLAKCPAHEDRKPSLHIDEGSDGKVLLKCFAGCSLDEILSPLGLTKRDLFPQSDTVRPAPPPKSKVAPKIAAFDWSKCVAAMTNKDIEQIAKWRGFKPEFVRELRDKKLIGIRDGLVAFPVKNNGKIVGAHVRKKDGNWFHTPSGINAAPFVFGDSLACERPQLFESTWDGLDYIDKSGEWEGIIITRGASNGALVAGLIADDAVAYLWTQNDAPDLKTGKQAGEEWSKTVCEHAPKNCAIKRVNIPAHDLNDWTRNGATVDDLISAMASAETLREPEYSEGVPLMTLAERDIDPENNLLGNRFLCLSGIMFFVGPSGVGKSSVSAQQDISWSLGRPAFHIRPARPLRILCIQAENDEDDLTEMASGVCKGLNLSPEEREIVRRNVIYISDCSHTGDHFLAMLEFYLKKFAPIDLVRIDTLTAYIGGDLLSVEITSKFLRNGLNSILRKFRCAAIINHHTPKPTNIDRSQWRPSDWMYFGAGNADLTNAPRATMSMDSTHAPDVFEFRAGKRGRRLGWVDEKDEPTMLRYFCWDKGATIYWRDATDEDIKRVQSLKPSRGRSTLSTGTIDDFFNLIPPTDSIEKNVLLQNAASFERGDKRIGLNKGRAYLTELIDGKRAFERRIKRAKTNPRIEISRHEQTLV